MFDNGISNEDLVNERTSLLKDLHNINMCHSLDMAQKANIPWSIEGDENSKFFYGIINMKRSQLAIRGVLVQGDWIDEPYKVKNEFLNHFSNSFARPTDFRSISLIGCFYKIIAKILANRLSMVISDLISDVQSAFVSSCQILDGPFILNVLLSWCKFHKSKAMIFKVYFKKTFDSVRWDYLDGILSNFGFGTKWKGWIQGCLTSAMGSIIVNGSPTSEFKFHKGLKQRDPLSHFLFILVIKSLHLSFNNILNAGLFKGFRIDDSLTLSHLVYADDAVFIGKWDRANVVTIVRMLKCFFMASRLQINIHKSKLMGIGVSHEEVKAAANIIGCSTFSTPFNYLGVKVGMSSSKRKSWDEKKVGNGVHTLFWDDTWINDIPLSQTYPRLYALEIILSNSNDRWVWLLDSSGECSVSSARSCIDDLLLPTVGYPTRWVKVFPIKINNFAWKVCLDKLPTRLNLSLRGIDIPSIICPICSLAGESCSRLLFSCSVARVLWRKVACWSLPCYVVGDLKIPQSCSFWKISTAYGSSL
nr:RNA-directed DNA polymerase, eukaryota [Tanacetum cinerariifolium]